MKRRVCVSVSVCVCVCVRSAGLETYRQGSGIQLLSNSKKFNPSDVPSFSHHTSNGYTSHNHTHSEPNGHTLVGPEDLHVQGFELGNGTQQAAGTLGGPSGVHVGTSIPQTSLQGRVL